MGHVYVCGLFLHGRIFSPKWSSPPELKDSLASVRLEDSKSLVPEEAACGSESKVGGGSEMGDEGTKNIEWLSGEPVFAVIIGQRRGDRR
jgi:hypothetical protein